MGVVIPKEKELEIIEKNDNLTIYCYKEASFLDEKKNINMEIAMKLIEIPEKARTLKIVSVLKEVISSYPDNTLFEGLDVLFNPAYEIDILMMLVSLRRNYKFKIVWPGQLKDNELIYSEEGYKDYTEFNIEKYDIMCIV